MTYLMKCTHAIKYLANVEVGLSPAICLVNRDSLNQEPTKVGLIKSSLVPGSAVSQLKHVTKKNSCGFLFRCYQLQMTTVLHIKFKALFPVTFAGCI